MIVTATYSIVLFYIWYINGFRFHLVIPVLNALSRRGRVELDVITLNRRGMVRGRFECLQSTRSGL